MEDPNVDALAIQVHPVTSVLPKEARSAFRSVVEASKAVVLWVVGMESGCHENLVCLEENHVRVFSSPEKAIRAFSALRWISRPDMGRF